MLNYEILPNPNMTEGLRRYFEKGILPGSHMTNILCNDLRGACESADDLNQLLLFQHVSWLYNEAPIGSWGSDTNVRAFTAARRLASQETTIVSGGET